MPYKSIEERRARDRQYAKDYYQKHKDKILNRQKNHYVNNKPQHAKTMRARREAHMEMIEQIKLQYGCQNPKCEWVGSFVGCDLDLHHIDQSEKEYSVGKIVLHRLETIAKEINKCTVLCAVCHRRCHQGLVDVSKCQECVVEIKDGAIIRFEKTPAP